MLDIFGAKRREEERKLREAEAARSQSLSSTDGGYNPAFQPTSYDGGSFYTGSSGHSCGSSHSDSGSSCSGGDGGGGGGGD